MRRFKELNLQNTEGSQGDFSSRAFTNTASVQQYQKGELLGAVFNPYAAPEAEQHFAVVGGEYVQCYRVVKEVNNLEHVWGIHFPNSPDEKKSHRKPDDPTSEELPVDDRKEILYCVAWAFDTFDHKNGGDPYKIICGGVLGFIYVVDFATRQLDNRLQSFGGDINEIRTCPTNSDLIACASSDQSIRVLHIRNSQCLICIGGLASHPSMVLSVDWHYTGEYLVTGGMDHQVMKWDLSTFIVKSHLKYTCDELAKGKRNIFGPQVTKPPQIKPVPPRKMCPDDTGKVKQVMESLDYAVDKVYHIYTPIAVCSDLHTNYVDCVRFLPGSDVIVSKDCGEQPTVNIFRFGAGVPRNEDAIPMKEPETCTTKIMSVTNDNGEVWFTKFAIDPRRRWLVCGCTRGIVNFIDLKYRDRPKINFSLTICQNTIRQVDFSPCGRFMVASGDDMRIVRLDRVPDTVDVSLLAKFNK
ncbi:hypothetical protein GCK72_015253 [Caenorhabditis remanei]|uniref:Uncharacterized protein n=1 Tax=Caenorhabditis remanei TaxID=31234 RepID=A0A6A5GWJ4_CAERE|nr:hypothetical protein GCK72_015253 [Caenorhabditis remanei]KAF1758793.1 hypothetical protein GCK72_015253 [Caenorhabditis remanei]